MENNLQPINTNLAEDEVYLDKYGRKRVYKEIPCNYCNQLFYKRKSFIEEGKLNYCCTKCRDLAKYYSDPEDALYKECSLCKVRKNRNSTDFYKKSTTSDKLSTKCKDCLNTIYVDKAKEYRDSNKESISQRNKEYRYKKYGITSEIYTQILESQKHLCAICNNPETRIRNDKVSSLVVDHCHSTGKFRGLICENCNIGLGAFKDNISSLTYAIDYLNKFNKELDNFE